MEKLVLIDGNSLINRAFYAMPVLSNKDGVFTNAVYGFMNMFFKMYSEENPSYIVVAFDMKAPTFRHGIFTEYKGTRKPMPEELRPQIPLLKDVLKLMGVKTIEKEGIEADDIIGTIAKNTDVKTIIITGDKDSFQLVDEQTEVHFTRRGITDVEIYNIDNFKEKTGLEPYQIVHLKALMGDSSDNIPGIPGVGEKTALTLLQKYENIDGLYANQNELTGKLKEKVIAGKDSCYLSKTLATIKTDCEIDLNLQNMRFSLPLSSAVRSEFMRLEFKKLSSNDSFFSTEEEDEKEQKNSTENQIKKVVLTPNESFDLPSDDFLSIVIDNFSCSYSNGEVEYILPIKKTLFDEGFSLSEAIEFIKPLFSSDKTLLLYSKKDVKRLLKETLGLSITAFCHDLSIVKYLADYSGGAETLASVLNAYSLDAFTPASSMLKVFNELYDKLKAEDMLSLYLDVELPLADVLFEMENSGFKIDVLALEQTGAEYHARLTALEKEIRELTDEPTLNVNSPKQLGETLFNKLKIGKAKKTKTGYSTSAEVLESLEGAHPSIEKILSYRKIQKLNSTYVEGLKNIADRNTGVVRTCFNQTVTSTGRLSSKEPNLQNIPVREEEGRVLRKFFVPRSSNRILIGADYSQIELRLLAAFSGCPSLVKAFNDGVDVHTATASKVFGVDKEKVTKEMRSKAKAVNFGIIYGISEYGLAKNLKISPAEAKSYIISYFNEYPEVREYMDKNVEFTRRTGYAKTLLGRRRVIREINSPNYNLRSFGERAAMNMPLQGSSADVIKLAMLGVSARLKREGLRSELILQVHDELIIDAFKDEAEKVKKILKEEMENATKLKVKLTVEVGEGETWLETK